MDQGQKRIIGILLVVLLALAVIVGRLFYLQFVRYSFFKDRVVSQVTRTIPLPAKRGNIVDRNGYLLASTMEANAVYVNGAEVEDKLKLVTQLSSLIGLEPPKLYARIKDVRYFILVKRKISQDQAEAVRLAKIKGVYLTQDQKRVYLKDKLASHVIGYVDQENIGQAGVEYYLDKYLQGIPGKLIIERDPLGQEISAGKRTLEESRDGDNVQLTLDEFLQYVASRELKKSITETKALGGSAIIMNTQTGEILAMVSLPDYDPNNYFQFPLAAMRNSNVHTVYEPGSVLKILTVAAALENKIVSMTSTFKNGNSLVVADKTIRESHLLKDPERVREISEILVESLNIGVARLSQQIGKERLHKFLTKFKLDRRSGIELAGESAGLLKKPGDWNEVDEAVIGFGQGIAMTPVQLISAVNVISNDGVYVPPRLVKKISDNRGLVLKDFTLNNQAQRLISAETSRQIRWVLQKAVSEGTGARAQLDGYSISGKTGTSQKPNPNGAGYVPGEYISSFVGFVPGNKPKLTILVVVDTPKTIYYGGDVAAPVFRNIAEEAIRYLAIAPDI